MDRLDFIPMEGERHLSMGEQEVNRVTQKLVLAVEDLVSGEKLVLVVVEVAIPEGAVDLWEVLLNIMVLAEGAVPTIAARVPPA